MQIGSGCFGGGWWLVVRGTRDGGIAGVADVVDGSRSFYILILIGE